MGTVSELAYAVAIQPDGKLVIVGTRATGKHFKAIAMTRLEVNGAFDMSFGNAGKVFTNVERVRMIPVAFCCKRAEGFWSAAAQVPQTAAGPVCCCCMDPPES